MTTRTLRLAAASLALAILVPACTTPAGGTSPSLPSVSVPASVQSAAASAAGSGLEAFCDLDLANDPEISAVVESAQSATTGGNVDQAEVGAQVDAAVAEIEEVEVTGDAATARERLVEAMNAFGDNPSQATATALLAAHLAAGQAQRVACGA